MINATPHLHKDLNSKPVDHTKTETVPKTSLKRKRPYKKKYKNIKIILGSFVLLLLMLGSGAGLYLTQYTQQDIRQQAYVGKKGCTTDAQCDSDRKDPYVKEYCSSSGVCTTKAPQIIQPKDCGWAKHSEYSCKTLDECVQCVNGQMKPASRTSCEKQNPNALCKPSTNDANCGWANHNEYACKTLTECVKCVNGAMTSADRSKCANLACAPEEPKNEDKEIPKDKDKPNPKDEDKINPGDNIKTCGKLNQSCCDQKATACDTGLNCENKKCVKPTTTNKRYSCVNGACKEDPKGDFLNMGSCSADCKANDTPPVPYTNCSQKGTQSCKINGQLGTQNCTFTRTDYKAPYSCNQVPTNCDSCVATEVKECTYSSNSSQNDKECSNSKILNICNTANQWNSITCEFSCSGSSCCGEKGQSCCPGSNSCSDGNYCGEGRKCKAIEVTPDVPENLPIESPLSGASCDGTNFIQVCGESMIQLCQYTTRDTKTPYECNQNMSCGQCVKVDATITSIDSGTVVQTPPVSGCNPQTQKPYCLNDYTVAQCLSNQQTGEWYEVDCSTKCVSGVCLDPTTYANQQANYTLITNSIRTDENSTFNILDVTSTN